MSIRGLLSAGFYSLSQNINKTKGKDESGETTEGVVSAFLPELTLSLSNEELIKLTTHWERKWNESSVRATWISQVEANENYWKGKQFNNVEMETLRPLMENIIFEGTETFLPAATRQNPEPVVELKSTEPQTDVNLKYATIIRNRLVDWADEVKLRLKLKAATRHWFLSLVGVAKMGWDLENDRPSCKILRPRRVVFDPDGVIDEDGYKGEYIGEYRKLKASVLIEIVKKNGEPEAEKAIRDAAQDQLGTEIQFIEWWTKQYLCWKLNDHILLKKKNPNWNYDQKEATPAAEGAMPSPYFQPTKGQNHFKSPQMPYIILSIFNLGKTPVDETSLISQVLPQQDLVNKRLKQIDANADNANNGLVISGERSGLTREEAKQAGPALRRGGMVWIPAGAPQDAIYKPATVVLSPDIYTNLYDTRDRFREILGVKGIQSQGLESEKTATGKILSRGLDTDRIGGGITEYIEQFADDIFNHVIQLMYVYDDIIAPSLAKGSQVPRLRASVKEGSLLPKDPVAKAEQAIQLATGGAMALVDLYEALEYPNPEEMAAHVWLQENAPHILFKDNQEVQQAMQMIAQQNQDPEKPPNLPYKELPPTGKSALAAQAGIQLSPQDIARYELGNKVADATIKERAKYFAPPKVSSSKNKK